MTHKPLILGLAGLIAIAVSVLAGSSDYAEATHTVTAGNIAVDTVTAGNTATALGTRDSCFEAAAGADVTVDVTMTNIPAATPAIGFDFNVMYNPAVLIINSADANFLLASAPGSTIAAAGDESTLPTTATPGTYHATVIDTAAGTGTQETGSGVLERLSIHVDEGATNGGYPLTVITGSYVDNLGTGHDGGTYFSGQIAVGVTCGSLPTPESPPALMGDVDCSNTVNAIDALKVLRNNAGLSVVQTEPCVDIGFNVPHVGDVDCSGAVNAVDALKIQRHSAGLSVTQTEPCDNLGT